MNDDRDHLPAPLLCPFRLPTSICNVATHTYFEHLQHTHLLNMPEHIMWFLYIRMRMIWSPITLPMSVARCSSPSSFSFSRPSSFSSSSIWLIGMRMIWSPITPPMSVAPRGSRVWQPPTVPIMYCFFNPAVLLYQTIFHNQYTQCFALLKEEKIENMFTRIFSKFKIHLPYQSPLWNIVCQTMANKIRISGEEGSEESSSFSFLVAQEALALVWVKDSFSGFQVFYPRSVK